MRIKLHRKIHYCQIFSWIEQDFTSTYYRTFQNIHSLLDKTAITLSGSAREIFTCVTANTIFYEKEQRWCQRLNFEKLAVLRLPLVISNFSGATAIAYAFFSGGQQCALQWRSQEHLWLIVIQNLKYVGMSAHFAATVIVNTLRTVRPK